MGCIRVDKITEYLCDPLQRCLKVSPYDCLDYDSPLSGLSFRVVLICIAVFGHIRNIFGTENVGTNQFLVSEIHSSPIASSHWSFLVIRFRVITQDDDPYVRKTAAVCVAKLHDINAELVEDRGFLEALKDMISDSNPMVVANAVAALAEIQEGSSKNVFEITNHTLFKLLAALNECTEYVVP